MTETSSSGTSTPPAADPVVLISERFISPVGPLQRLDLPDDVRNVARGVALDAIIIDEFGRHCRRVRIAPPPPGMAGNRIEFEAIPILPQARLWLFVIEAGYGAGVVTPTLVNTLLEHGRKLGGRPPITLIWVSDPAAPHAP